MPSFYIPLSGLDADSTALNTIANNLSNMNTTGIQQHGFHRGFDCLDRNINQCSHRRLRFLCSG